MAELGHYENTPTFRTQQLDDFLKQLETGSIEKEPDSPNIAKRKKRNKQLFMDSCSNAGTKKVKSYNIILQDLPVVSNADFTMEPYEFCQLQANPSLAPYLQCVGRVGDQVAMINAYD